MGTIGKPRHLGVFKIDVNGDGRPDLVDVICRRNSKDKYYYYNATFIEFGRVRLNEGVDPKTNQTKYVDVSSALDLIERGKPSTLKKLRIGNRYYKLGEVLNKKYVRSYGEEPYIIKAFYFVTSPLWALKKYSGQETCKYLPLQLRALLPKNTTLPNQPEHEYGLKSIKFDLCIKGMGAGMKAYLNKAGPVKIDLFQ